MHCFQGHCFFSEEELRSSWQRPPGAGTHRAGGCPTVTTNASYATELVRGHKNAKARPSGFPSGFSTLTACDRALQRCSNKEGGSKSAAKHAPRSAHLPFIQVRLSRRELQQQGRRKRAAEGCICFLGFWQDWWAPCWHSLACGHNTLISASVFTSPCSVSKLPLPLRRIHVFMCRVYIDNPGLSSSSQDP